MQIWKRVYLCTWPRGVKRMETRVRQEKEGKTQKGHRGQRRNMFFRNSVKDFERTTKRCESLYFLIIVFLFFVSYETESLSLLPVGFITQLLEHCIGSYRGLGSSYDRHNLFIGFIFTNCLSCPNNCNDFA